MRARARTHTHAHTHRRAVWGVSVVDALLPIAAPPLCRSLSPRFPLAGKKPRFWPSPTLSPTDPVPRGLLTLCPGASSGPQGLYTAYTQAIHGLYTLPLAPSGIAPEQAPPRTYWPCVRAYTALVLRVLCVRASHGTGAGLLSRCHAVLLSRCARLRHGDVRVGSVHCRPCRRRG